MKPVRTIPLLVSSALLLSACVTQPVRRGEDWRKGDDAALQLKNLVNLVPGTSHWMIEVGERYKNLYWAAKEGQWDFANYQLEEIEKLIQTVQLARVKRAATAQVFLDTAIPPLRKPIETRDGAGFQASFDGSAAACMNCHAQNQHAFIVVPRVPRVPPRGSSPVLGNP